MNSILKYCPQCKENKPRSEFYKSKDKPDGLYGWCKQCKRGRQRKISRTWYWDKMKGERPKPNYDAENRRKQQQEYRDENRDAMRAHDAIAKAVQAGKMKPASDHICPRCGEQAAHYHHYNGYKGMNKFRVVPLCARCHGLERRK